MLFPEFQRLSKQEKHILFAAAILHDVEKRSTTTTEEIDGMERIVSPRPAKKGAFTVRILLYKKIHNRAYKVPEMVIDKLINKLEIPSYSEAHEVSYIISDT